ncbi:MAG: hypothetical protein F2842_05285 [Actinobacteria bacterium]|uniref:Unannotated protein n=1 Tax=freshwater metagenome TaxID=449393 RepID=A0A6J7JNE0_9ZZZZ|nr:hypothetical protein [Actinomycetota bacterium]MSW41604.1 hypothetical protein [Actinomycetota bacterium]
MNTDESSTTVIELTLDSGTTCIGELRAVESPQAVCLLLHDRHADIDHMRTLADSVVRYSMTALLIDLPGHGLSDGDLEADGASALDLAMGYSTTVARPLCIIAEGSSADLLLRSEPSVLVAAYALVSPRSDITDDEFCASPWMSTPSITVLDPHDAVAAAVAALVARRTRGAAVRVFAHKIGKLGSGRASWPLQTAQSSAQFLAEHAAFSRASQPANPYESVTPGGAE